MILSVDNVYLYSKMPMPFISLSPVPDEAVRGPEEQLFEGSELFNKNQCPMVSP